MQGSHNLRWPGCGLLHSNTCPVDTLMPPTPDFDPRPAADLWAFIAKWTGMQVKPIGQ